MKFMHILRGSNKMNVPPRSKAASGSETATGLNCQFILIAFLRHIVQSIPVVLVILVCCGCPKVEKKPDESNISPTQRAAHMESETATRPETQTTGESAATSEQNSASKSGPEEEAELAISPSSTPADEINPTIEPPEKPRDLGPPLVDNPESLKRVHPDYPVWIDWAGKKVVMVGEICQTEVPLEMFACLRGTKEHESIVSVPTEAFIVHGALLAVGAKAGSPVQYVPEYAPATGSEIEITVRWKNSDGKVQTARAQDWVRDYKTGKKLDHPWVFAGSGFWKDESTDKEYYKAEGGDFICVANFPSAMLDLPIKSSESNAELLFHAYTERIPPRGTSVTLILAAKNTPTEVAPPP